MVVVVDYFELAVVLGSCFLVNYVTADSKTNWVEVRAGFLAQSGETANALTRNFAHARRV